ncbi:hypothetical protein H0H93_008926 [Arthromyces matolae]|nr:hypothetical protein H0H93_008926 [Arthromyces matolae]
MVDSFESALEKLGTTLTVAPPALERVDGPPVRPGYDGIKDAMVYLLDGIGYKSPVPDRERQADLRRVLHSEFAKYFDDMEWFERACGLAALLTECGYQKHSYEIQLQVARYNLIIIWIDDCSDKSPEAMEKFQLSILSYEIPDHELLDELRGNFRDAYLLYEPLSANGIVTSTMEYVNGSLLECLQVATKTPISPHAKSWPYYLRDKTGVAAAYSFMLFPKSSTYSLMDYIQVIPDINMYINIANDVLSFYKEELTHETINYMHNRTCVNGKTPVETLHDVARDTVGSYLRVCAVLQKTPALLETWRIFAYGYM